MTRLKKLNVTGIEKPWVLSMSGKPLVRNVIYIGDTLPDFLRESTQRTVWTLKDENGNTIDDNIRVKIKNTIKAYLISRNCDIKPRRLNLKAPVKYIGGVYVNIKQVTGKGWGIIIGGKRRKSVNISTDTIQIRKYLETQGIVVEDKNICSAYCKPRTDEEIIVRGD